MEPVRAGIRRATKLGALSLRPRDLIHHHLFTLVLRAHCAFIRDLVVRFVAMGRQTRPNFVDVVLQGGKRQFNLWLTWYK